MHCYAEGVRHGEKRKKSVLDFDKASPRKDLKHEINRIFGFFSVKDRNLFHLMNTMKKNYPLYIGDNFCTLQTV